MNKDWADAFEYKHWHFVYDEAFAEGEKSTSEINPYADMSKFKKFSKDYFDNQTRFSGFRDGFNSKIKEKEFHSTEKF